MIWPRPCVCSKKAFGDLCLIRYHEREVSSGFSNGCRMGTTPGWCCCSLSALRGGYEGGWRRRRRFWWSILLRRMERTRGGHDGCRGWGGEQGRVWMRVGREFGGEVYSWRWGKGGRRWAELGRGLVGDFLSCYSSGLLRCTRLSRELSTKAFCLKAETTACNRILDAKNNIFKAGIYHVSTIYSCRWINAKIENVEPAVIFLDDYYDTCRSLFHNNILYYSKENYIFSPGI